MALAAVGGALLSAVFNVILDKMASPEFVNLIRGKKPNKLLQDMKMKLMVVEVVLNDAEKRQITDSKVNKWLDVLRDVVYDVEDLLDEISTKAATQKEVSKSFSRFFNRKKMVNITKLEDIVARLDNILKLKESLNLKEIPVENETWNWKVPSTSLEEGYGIYGREKDKEIIMKLLLEDNSDAQQVSVIPIVGMGGVGKTTLARSVYNDEDLKQFSKAWVCLSDKFDIVKVTKSMIEQVTQKSCELNNLNSLQLDLMEKLKDKTFLIVMDDVWIESYDNWRSLTKPFLSGTKGSKILVTTRDENVASIFPFNIVQVHHLRQLSNEDCWLVFANHAFPPSESSENRSTLENIGREIVKKCKGLPLAAQSLGGMLRRKHAVEYWKNILESDIWELPESRCEIIPALRISYHYLPPHLKRCFVYCSLYPKDYEFHKNELVLLWMAEDLVIPPKKGKKLKEVGSEYFEELASRSFFQHSSNRTWGNFFVMHDLIHDLAASLGGEFYLRSEELGKETKFDVKMRHLSFAKFSDPVSDIKFFGRVKVFRTFLPISFQPSPFNNEKAPCIIISKLTCLRVLSFSGWRSLEALPDSIGELIYLRYLNLSHTSLKTLPESLCNLYNLQTLQLSSCHQLTKLPSGMQNLVNLRHVDIDGTSIEEMPRGMGKLNHLQHLNFFIVGKHEENGIKELGGLSNLEGSFSIENLENVTQSEEALEARIKDKKNITSLSLLWSAPNDNGTDFQIELEVLRKLQPHHEMESLSIYGYNGTRFPDWVGEFSYHKMTSLHLSTCENCHMLPSLGQLPSLKKLGISKLNSVKTVDECFYKNGCSPSDKNESLESLSIRSSCDSLTCFPLGTFPNLRSLEIDSCINMESLWVSGSESFKSLRSFRIENCPKFVSFPREGLPAPNLTYFRVSNCNKLRRLPDEMSALLPMLYLLQIRDCPEIEWFPGGAMPSKLTRVVIDNCEKLVSGLAWPSMDMLTYLTVEGPCDGIKSFPEEGLLPPSITSLRLSNLSSLETLDCKGLLHLKSLQKLKILECLKLENVVGERLPDSLIKLTISGCPLLGKRCRTKDRQIWPKISHIRGIQVDERWI